MNCTFSHKITKYLWNKYFAMISDTISLNPFSDAITVFDLKQLIKKAQRPKGMGEVLNTMADDII